MLIVVMALQVVCFEHTWSVVENSFHVSFSFVLACWEKCLYSQTQELGCYLYSYSATFCKLQFCVSDSILMSVKYFMGDKNYVPVAVVKVMTYVLSLSPSHFPLLSGY